MLKLVLIIIFFLLFSLFNYINSKKITRRDELIDFLLSIGANTIQHGRKTLYDHLLSTYDIIMQENGDETIALVGGLHSIYGTTLFKKNAINKEDDLVSKQFGTEIDRLVRLFSSISRTLIRDSSPEIPEDDLYVLQWVEYANVKDQDILYKIPKIVARIKTQDDIKM